MDPEVVNKCRRKEIISKTKCGDVYLRIGSFVPLQGEFTDASRKKLDSTDVRAWRSYGAWWSHFQEPKRQLERQKDRDRFKAQSSRYWPYGQDINLIKRSDDANANYQLDKRVVHRVIPQLRHQVNETINNPGDRPAGKICPRLVPTNYDTLVYPYT